MTQCPDCGPPRCGADACTPAPTPAPTLVCRTASASRTKCGYGEYVVSTPLKIYLTRALSGSITCSQNANNDCSGGCDHQSTYTWSGSCSYSRPACTLTTGGSQFEQDYLPCTNPTTSSTISNICRYEDGFICASTTQALTATTRTLTAVGCDGAKYNQVGSVVETLSSEYTTAQLDSDVDAAIPAFSGSYSSGTCSGAYYNKTTDELTISKRGMQYKFTLPDLSTWGIGGGYYTYSISWVERFTPTGGGSPTDTVKCYQWDGSATETGVYTINPPSTNGTTTIQDVVAGCVTC